MAATRRIRKPRRGVTAGIRLDRKAARFAKILARQFGAEELHRIEAIATEARKGGDNG